MPGPDIHARLETVWRMESGRIVAGLARIVGDLGRAEELAQDAFVAALEQWPRTGVPDNPGAWLTTAAKRRAIDDVRRRPMLERTHGMLAYEIDLRQQAGSADMDAQLDRAADDLGDERLGLAFAACHPILAHESRVALTLKLLCGLTTAEIARAYLLPEPTVAQRLVRAKRTLAKAHVGFEIPRGEARAARLASVLEVVYLVFNEGYSATAGDSYVRPTLCGEALRLGRALAALAPEEAEVHGLVALMELQSSRLRARVDAAGRAVRLADQSRASWDRLLIRRGLAALARADARSAEPGPYHLQAAIAACHARATAAEPTDWPAIAALYDRLSALTGSPVVELNRAVAVSMAAGPEAALPIVDALIATNALPRYHLVPAVRGDLLERLTRPDEAREEFERAAALAANDRERELLLDRAARAGRSSTAPR